MNQFVQKINLWLRLIILCILFPYLVNYFVYYGFVSNYSVNVFSEQSFRKQYDHGIYKYRIIGKEILLKTYEIIKNKTDLENQHDKAILFLDENGNSAFYRSYFLVNTFFNILTSLLFYLVLHNRKLFSLDNRMIIILNICLVLLIAITQYVITPYDGISYCFFILSVPLIIELLIKPGLLKYLLLLFVIIFSTLTRESSAMILAMYAALFLILIKSIPNKNTQIFLFGGCIITYLITYFSLRIYFGFNNGIYQSDAVLIFYNLTGKQSHIGIMLFLAMLYILGTLAISKLNSKLFIRFVVFCTPYLVFCFFTGLLFEIRLWMPIIIPGLFLVNLDLEKVILNINSANVKN